MSRDEELTRGAILFEITPEQREDAMQFLRELLEKTRALHNYFLQSKIDCLPDPQHHPPEHSKCHQHYTGLAYCSCELRHSNHHTNRQTNQA